MTQSSSPMTKEQFLQQIGEIISKYEDDTGQIVGAYIEPNTNDRTEVHQWNGDRLSEGKCSIKLEEVEGTAEFDAAKERRLIAKMIDEGSISR
jgi:hypothetical protein